MFGCFGKFIKIIIVILAIIGFVAVGGVTFFKKFIDNPFENIQKMKKEKASKIADFSKLDDEFELVSSSVIPTVGTYVYVKHNASSQNFFFIKTNKKNFLTKKDFAENTADDKIINFAKDFKLLNLEDFEIIGHGSTSAFSQNIPYSKFKTRVANMPVKGVEGIIFSVPKDDENIVIVASNSSSKYSQIITNALFEQLR